MKDINVNLETGAKFITFPDSQPHVNIPDAKSGDKYAVTCALTSPKALLQLMEIANAIDTTFGLKEVLIIPYLMGARSDREIRLGDSVDLKVIARCINMLMFRRVVLHDVHSDVAVQLIERSTNVSNQYLVKEYDIPNSVLIVPDAGAAKKTEQILKWNLNIVDYVQCLKKRDADGKITLQVLESHKCANRPCVIVDDLCDAGGTFLGIASQIAPSRLTLIVTHGIFSKGYAMLDQKFDQIITSDSYRDWPVLAPNGLVKIVPFVF